MRIVNIGNKTLAVGLVICLAIFSCDKVDELLTFTVDHQVDITVEGSSPLDLPIDIITPEVSTNSSQQFKNNNTNANLVKDIKLSQLQLTITNPTGKTFNFLKSIQIYISTDQNNEILLAHADNIPMNVSTVALTPTTEKLDAYVKASSYKLRTKIITRETLSQSVDINVDLKFKVTADPL